MLFFTEPHRWTILKLCYWGLKIIYDLRTLPRYLKIRRHEFSEIIDWSSIGGWKLIQPLLQLHSRNRPLPNSKNLQFQNEAKCTTFVVKMSFICKRMKNHFRIKGWALNLVLIQTPGGTWKWPIAVFYVMLKVHVEFSWNFNWYVNHDNLAKEHSIFLNLDSVLQFNCIP